ncbi:MAG: ATP-binding cassette domain-containing protein [Deltaproteobacteria bacterium]|nr:ATP-binding cassette domain-containing protein [Deltaproteobacteria bacterium]
MSLIVLEQGVLSFGGQEILRHVNLRVGEGERIGLVGANGSGKSTLLRVLAGAQGLDGGSVRPRRGCRIGYLPQDVLELAGETVLGSVLATVPGREEIAGRLAAAEEALASETDEEEQLELARHLSELQEQVDHFDTYFNERQAIRLLVGLGFREQDLGRPTRELSGGWKMRAALAGLLFQNPDALFLDEPTNHLDVPSVRWLDGFLATCKSALALICHDRQFLNRHIHRVVSFEPEGVRSYKGNYDDYLKQRAAEEEILEARARNRDREIRELQRFVDRFKAKASKARQAQSRAKQIERMEKEIEQPVARPRRLNFHFPPTTRTGRDAIIIEGLCKSYGELRLYENFSRTVQAGDRVAILGVNGVGKTTLLKMLAGELKPDGGTIRFGANVEVGYYAQHHTELLDRKRTVLEEVWRIVPNLGESAVRGMCGSFLFSGDDVDKAVGVLSGGERARVLLARLLAKPGNLLLMDEPTNHLDIAASEALAEALASFDGTLVFVSHNSSFLNRLATKIWDLTGDGQVVEHLGNLDDYFARTQAVEPAPAGGNNGRRPAPVKGDAGRKGAPKPPDSPPARAENRASASAEEDDGARRESSQERKERKRREADRRNELSRHTGEARKVLASLEQRIGALESDQKELEPKLADPELYTHKEVFRQTMTRYEENRRKLEELYGRWEHQQAELERLTAEVNAAAES